MFSDQPSQDANFGTTAVWQSDPVLSAYVPQAPKSYRPKIGLIACGGITRHHLQAYRDAGWEVVALCDARAEMAQERQREFYPVATVFTDYRDLLNRDDIDVVDIATHPPQRPPIVRAAIEAGKHILSQKPFVTDLDEGQELVELAKKKGVLLAVNQNGRWAPHFSYARHAVQAGYIGQVFGAHLSCHWDHTWVRGTAFENVKHLVLYDYAIHWFDILRCLLPASKPLTVFASTGRTPNQEIMPNLLAQVLIQWDNAQSTLAFDAAVPAGSNERTYLSGTAGSLFSTGSGNQNQTLRVSTTSGSWEPNLKGKWFPDGFRGAMGELLCAIEEGRQPSNSAVDNLESLALCFAAIASADQGIPMRPGDIRRAPT